MIVGGAAAGNGGGGGGGDFYQDHPHAGYPAQYAAGSYGALNYGYNSGQTGTGGLQQPK